MKKWFPDLKVKAATGFLLLSQKASNIQRPLFYFLILFIPAQFGRHFWPESSYIAGIRVDYLSPTLYFTDILILLIFVFWIFSKKKFIISNFSRFVLQCKTSRGKQFSILAFASFLLIGIFMSKNPSAGFYGLLKLSEFGFLGFYVAYNIRKLKLENTLLVFSIGIILESFLSIAQYSNHGSINGVFYFFGERFFNSQTPGIANASLGGELFLRPYGTFSHPNVFAGYLVIAMTLIVSRIKNYESRIRVIIFILTLIIGTIALFLTLSRIAILLWLVIVGFYFVRKFIIHNSYFIFHTSCFLIFLIVGFLFFVLFTPLGGRFKDIKLTDEAIVQRESLIQSSLAMIRDHPIFGVGINNFLVNLPSYQKPNTSFYSLQPVHNIFLLVGAETGVVGLGFFLWFLIKTYKRIMNHESRIMNKVKDPFRNSLFIILSSVLFLGMFDHYFLTLQQGQMLFAFVIGLCWSQKPR